MIIFCFNLDVNGNGVGVIVLILGNFSIDNGDGEDDVL